MGGIETGADAAAFIASGASLVAVGTANFRDPTAAARVRFELDSRDADQFGTASLASTST
jgi:dihydroorotate dehydrogenase (NAD+) catalytic subunit